MARTFGEFIEQLNVLIRKYPWSSDEGTQKLEEQLVAIVDEIEEDEDNDGHRDSGVFETVQMLENCIELASQGIDSSAIVAALGGLKVLATKPTARR